MLKVLRKVKSFGGFGKSLINLGVSNLSWITINNARSPTDFKHVMNYVIKNGIAIKQPTKLLDRTRFTDIEELYIYTEGVMTLWGVGFPVLVTFTSRAPTEKQDLLVTLKFGCLPQHLPKLEELIQSLLVRKIGGVDVMYTKNTSFGPSKPIPKGHIDESYKHQKQYISPETYKLCDNAFNRMVNDPDYYSRNGLAYKEVILMHGTPGGGKTSLIRHMSVKYNVPIVTVNDIKDLSHDIGATGVRIVLIDELDGYASCLSELSVEDKKSFDRFSKNETGQLTHLLNYLDGVIPLHGEIVIYTSNDPDKINPAITRGGRTTLKLRLDAPDNQGVLKHVDSPHMDYLNTLPEGKLKLSMINKLNVASSLEEVKDIISSEEDF